MFSQEQALWGAPWGTGQHPTAPFPSHSLLDSLQNHKSFLEVYPSWGQKFSKREEGKKRENNNKKKKTQEKKNKHYFLNISGFRNLFPGQREEVPEPGWMKVTGRPGPGCGRHRPPHVQPTVPGGSWSPDKLCLVLWLPGRGKPATEQKRRLVIQARTKAQGSSQRNICDIPPQPRDAHSLKYHFFPIFPCVLAHSALESGSFSLNIITKADKATLFARGLQ